MRKQTDTLNDIADIAAQLILIHLANSLILHIDFALIRNQKTIDQLQNVVFPLPLPPITLINSPS